MDINKIKRKRMNLRTKIREYINKGKDVSDLYNQYINILNELKSVGVKVSTKETTAYLKNLNKPKFINPNNKINIEIENNYYILNLAWTGEESIIGIDKYLNHIGLQYLEVEDFGEEHIAKYKYIGEDNGFNVIKKSTQYILDSFVSNQNINVYGKKLNYKI